VTADEIAARLQREGVDVLVAEQAAAAAGGNVERARLLTTDPELAERRRAFAGVPYRLDGHGATVMRLTDELLALVDSSAQPLTRRQIAEIAELDERIARYGERGSGKKALDERHKRELRRHRTDALLAGLTLIAGAYRDALVSRASIHPTTIAEAVSDIHRAMESFERNPNEALMLQALLWRLPVLSGSAGR
jgi:DNA polymerase-3 subunit delta'